MLQRLATRLHEWDVARGAYGLSELPSNYYVERAKELIKLLREPDEATYCKGDVRLIKALEANEIIANEATPATKIWITMIDAILESNNAAKEA